MPPDRPHLTVVPEGRHPLTGTALSAPVGWRLGKCIAATPASQRFDVERQGPLMQVLQDPGRSVEMSDRTRVLESLDHPQVQGVAGTGLVQGRAYRADRPVDGPRLEAELARVGPVRPSEVIARGLALAQVLVELHARGLVHGSLGVASVRCVDEAGCVVPMVTDFPLVLEAEAESLQAPEVQLGARPDPRSDLFGLGLVLVSMLRGSAPGDDASWRSGKPGPVVVLPPAVELPEGLSDLISSLLDRDPRRRPRTAVEVADTLARLRGAEESDAGLPMWARLGIAVAVLGGIALASWGFSLTVPEPDPVVQDAPAVEPSAPVAPEPPVADAGTDAVETPAPGADAVPPTLQVQPPSERIRPESTREAPIREAPTREAVPREATGPTPEPDPDAVTAEAPVEEPAVVEAPAVVDAEEPAEPEPVEPAAPDYSHLSGSWSGTSNGRPLTLEITVSADGRVSGKSTVRLGAQWVVTPVSGRITGDQDGARITLNELEGRRPNTWSGTLNGGSLSGSLTADGASRGSWSASK
jgi:hypothetical protein